MKISGKNYSKMINISVIIIILIMISNITFGVAVYALADQVISYPPSTQTGFTPELIMGGKGEVLAPAAGGGLVPVLLKNFPTATLALIAGLEGLYLTYEGNGILPRMVDIYTAIEGKMTYEEQQELKRAVWALDRDGFIYMWDLSYYVRKPIHDFLVEMVENISTEGHYTLEEFTITEDEFINPNPGSAFTFQVACPIGGELNLEFTQIPLEVAHDFGYVPDDSDGSSNDQLDRWRFHAYMGEVLKLDYFESAIDPVTDFYTPLEGKLFGQYYNGPVNFTITDEGIYLNGNLVYDAQALANPNKVRFTGHTDIWVSTMQLKVNQTVGIPDPVVLDDDAVLDDGSDYRQEVYGEQEFSAQIDPYSDIGTAMIVVPEGAPETWSVGEISPESSSVIQPVPESVPNPYVGSDPYAEGGLGELPVTVPDTINPENFPKVNNYEEFKNRFPFCIPWDILRIFELFDRYAETAPTFEIPVTAFLVPSAGTVDKVHHVDFEFLDPYVQFIRYMELIIADLILIMWILRHYVAG